MTVCRTVTHVLRIGIIAVLLAEGGAGVFAKDSEPRVTHAPALKRFCSIDRMGKSVIPNGRFLTPRGRQVQVAPHPYGLRLSPDGKRLVTANSGVEPFSLSIITDLENYEPTVRQIPPGYETDEGILNAVFMGLAIAPDNRTLYASGGNDGMTVPCDPLDNTTL